MAMPNTNDLGFYESRNFKMIGKPLVWTQARSKLTTISMEQVAVIPTMMGVSIKLDGKFIRVAKRGKLLRMITSGNKDFYHNGLATAMEGLPDGQYNMEAVANNGVLGELHSLGYITSAYTDYDKQLATAGDWVRDGSNIRFVIHDYLTPSKVGDGYQLDKPYVARRADISSMYLPKFHVGPDILTDQRFDWFIPKLRCSKVEELTKYLGVTLGYNPKIHEGLVFYDGEGTYQMPRMHTSYKVKNVEECTGFVVDSERDKNDGNGTLIVVVDGKKAKDLGRICRVSSGIDDKIRGMRPAQIESLRVEIEYEKITADGEYTQPRIKRYFLT